MSSNDKHMQKARFYAFLSYCNGTFALQSVP